MRYNATIQDASTVLRAAAPVALLAPLAGCLEWE
jgi:hypothetical protein